MKRAVFLAALLNASIAAANPYTVETAIYRVEVSSRNGNQVNTSTGTGVLIAQDKILTNCHVVQGQSGWPKVVHRQSGQIFNVTKYYNLGNYDACVLVGGFAGNPVRLASNIVEGENVWIFGFPGRVPVVGQGTVDKYVDTDKGVSLLLNAFCAPGSSGGPVVNSKGELVGLNWGVFRYQSKCLSIPAGDLSQFLTGS